MTTVTIFDKILLESEQKYDSHNHHVQTDAIIILYSKMVVME